jgi:[NiFe] hydrogenase diaphorase moiety large subunit
MKDIISELKKAGLNGRGGANFPTGAKWELVKNTEAKTKYVICNGSEGEPGVKKDLYILEKYPEKVIDGIKIAIKYLSAKKAFIYLNPKYYKKFEKKLKKIINKTNIEIFKKPEGAGYVGGVDTTAINIIEKKRAEPRLVPPFPTESGLNKYPTLVNNVETFYDISLIMSGDYKNKRFYTINGDCNKKGVYELPENWTIEKILSETKNTPDFEFFVQVGGEASGEVLNKNQLDKKVSGAGSITVYDISKHDPSKFTKKYIDFFVKESCGQCTPCREGNYRLREIIYSNSPDWNLFFELTENMGVSFCGLGKCVPIPILSYFKNVFVNLPENKIKTIKNNQELLKWIK